MVFKVRSQKKNIKIEKWRQARTFTLTTAQSVKVDDRDKRLRPRFLVFKVRTPPIHRWETRRSGKYKR